MVHCQCTMVHCQCTMVHCQCTMVHRQCTMVLFLMGMQTSQSQQQQRTNSKNTQPYLDSTYNLIFKFRRNDTLHPPEHNTRFDSLVNTTLSIHTFQNNVSRQLNYNKHIDNMADKPIPMFKFLTWPSGANVRRRAVTNKAKRKLILEYASMFTYCIHNKQIQKQQHCEWLHI